MDTWVVLGAIGAWGAVVVGGIAIVLQRRGEKRANDRHRRTVQPRLAISIFSGRMAAGPDGTFPFYIANSGGAAIDALILQRVENGLFVARSAVPAQFSPTTLTVFRRIAVLDTSVPVPRSALILAKDIEGCWWREHSVVSDPRTALRAALSEAGLDERPDFDRLLTDLGADTL